MDNREIKEQLTPKVSIVIPAHNEEAILETVINDLRNRLAEIDFPSYEIIIAENGSCDSTLVLAAKLSKKFPNIRYISLREPNYGKALKTGILAARGEYVFCDEVDLCDVNFYVRALDILETGGADMVVGSKLLPGAQDKRPLFRHIASRVFNSMLRIALGFKGTDTHGVKAFKRHALLDVINSCITDKDMFPSEFVIRAERAGINVVEIPVRIIEKRSPTINLFKRVPNVLYNVGKLFINIRLKGEG